MLTIIAGISLGALLGAVLFRKMAADCLSTLCLRDRYSLLSETKKAEWFLAFWGGLYGGTAGGFGVASFF